MESFEYLIVGSGPAGVAAGRRLGGAGTCIVDIGVEPGAGFAFDSLAEALNAGAVRDLLGRNWEMLDNIADPLKRHAKVRSSGLAHVLNGEPFDVVGPDGRILVTGNASAAAGGAANVWGAQLMRYTDADLLEVGDWPITCEDLAPYYADLEAEIGLCGEVDDLAPFLGPVNGMMPPPPMVPAARYLLDQYANRRKRHAGGGLVLGRPRLALLTRPHRGRDVYPFGQTEFFTCGHPGLYTPRLTLDDLRKRGCVTYRAGLKALSLVEHATHVDLELLEIATGERHKIRAKHVLLAAGTIQTACLLLRTRGQPGITLPFMDHPPTLLPLFIPALFGHAVSGPAYPVQLAGTIESFDGSAMISLYYPGGMLWTDLLPDVPL
ncbi:unnamed protein product, partial [Phaeothamnion confervicola]